MGSWRPAWRGPEFLGAVQRHPEKEQAVLRVSLGTVVLIAYLVAAWIERSSAVCATTTMVALYVAYGLATYLAIKVGPARSPLRLIVTTVSDQAIVMAILAVGGQAALPVLWASFWFLVGAGCRYGKRMLGLSCAVALAGLAGLAFAQPWWSANVAVGVGLALSIAATSIYLSVLVHRLEQQAVTDPLTGLSNRVRLEQALDDALANRDAEAGDTALLLVDLDGFKEVNDRYGHAVGDALLQRFAIDLSRGVRRGDTLARLGGDEFVVLARQVHGKQGALKVADAIHTVLSNLQAIEGHRIAVSASIGVCMLANGARGAAPDARTLMRFADRAMYRAKANGRGQTAFAGSVETEPTA